MKPRSTSSVKMIIYHMFNSHLKFRKYGLLNINEMNILTYMQHINKDSLILFFKTCYQKPIMN